MQSALESAIAELVLGQELALDRPDALAAWLERHQVDPADRDAILNGGFERLSLYRKLVRATLRDAIELAIERTMARLGPLFDEYFDRFLAERAPRTHYLRDVTREFLDWVEPLFATDPRVPPWTLDLARHESLEIELGAWPALPLKDDPPPLELDAGVDFIDAVRLVHYRFAVHLLSEDVDDRTEPQRRDTDLFVYRSSSHDVRYLELSELAGAILARLVAKKSLREALVEGCRERGVALDQGVLDGAAKLLADLGARGVLVGRASGGPPEGRRPQMGTP